MRGGKTSGRILADFDLDPRQTLFSLAPAPDGALYLSGYAGADALLVRLDPATLLPSATLKGWQVTAARRPGVLLGVRPSGAGSELALIDPLTLQVLRSWRVEGERRLAAGGIAKPCFTREQGVVCGLACLSRQRPLFLSLIDLNCPLDV